MEVIDFKLNPKIVWILVIGNILFAIFSVIFKMKHLGFESLFLIIAITLFFSSWIIIVGDMAKQNIYNKTFWIMSMFIISPIASVSYLIMRDKLLRLGSKFGH